MKTWLTWSRVHVGALVFNGVCFSLIYRTYVWHRPKYIECDPPSEKHRLGIFNSIAETYDEIYKPIEKRMGIEDKRHAHFKQAKGHVLEIASGTGLNLSCYKNILSLTCVDKSFQMCKELAKRVDDLRPNFPVTIIHGDSTNLPFEDSTFDTVVTTHALCSVENPQNTVDELNRVLNTKGRYLSIERGRIYYGISRRLMKYLNLYPNPVVPWESGYYEDRDPKQLISRMNIKTVKVFNYGIHYMISASKRLEGGGFGTVNKGGFPHPKEGARIFYTYHNDEN